LVSAQVIGKYERGEMMPSSPVVIALALEVKNLFGISDAALVIRMGNLGIIGRQQCRTFFTA